MTKQKRVANYLSLPLILTLLLTGLPALAAPAAQGAGIAIDGVKEAAWGDPLASDPAWDMSEPNLDLQGLYVVEDADSLYIGFDALASTWGMAYGIYLDTDQVDGAGAISDPWARAIGAVSAHLPEHAIYVYHEDWDALQDAQLNHWDGAGWSYDSLVTQGGEQGYGPAEDWIEFRVPKAALGDPMRIALEAFTTGGGGHAQDTVPSDPNVAYSDPDWSGDVTVLSAFALFPAPAWYVKGDFNGWGLDDPMNDEGLEGDASAGDGIYTGLVTVAAAGRYEFKVATADWSRAYPGSGNSWLATAAADEVVTFTFDTNSYDDGWQPATHILGVSTDPGAWTAVGDWQGWNNADAATAMSDLGGGIYEFTTTIASPGGHQYKAVQSGTWDAVGADGRSVNAAPVEFSTTIDDQEATFRVDSLSGRVQVELEEPPPVPVPDDDVWWEGLGHMSRQDLYRVPWGAVTTDTPVTLRFRTYHNDVTGVTMRVWSTAFGAQSLYPMALVATTSDAPYGYDFWEATIPAQELPTILYYRFMVRDGSDEDYYEDDDLFDGGWGQAYEDSPDYGYQIDVYQPDFVTPDWMKNAIVYQIFPDRFFNGRNGNDVKKKDPTVYEQEPLRKAWNELPEGHCRGYVDYDCDEVPQGRDFYGGDLHGIVKKLPYLQELGVTALYLNPIFQAPSNHLYDTTDYYQIDPYFGTDLDHFERLVQEAQKHGIRVILDGVFNHTSSDSLYFDRYSRYRTEGAYESQDSDFYGWYTFYDWPDEYDSWWGFESLPALTEIPAVREFIYGADDSVARYWLFQGAQGWRLDVAPDKSHGFWQEFRPQVKSADPEAVIIGEIWDDASPWLLGDEFDSTMNYRFRRALLGFVNGDTNDPNQGFVQDLNPDQFNSIMQSIKEDYPPPAYATAMNLVGTHDTARILWMLTPGQRNPTDKENNVANLAEGRQKLKLLAIIQMTTPGAPTIYYGDEVGLTGDTDPDDRRPFPWDDKDAELLAHYQTLAGLRNEHSYLRTGSYDRLYTHNDEGTYAYGRKDGSGAAVVAVNRDAAAHALTIDLSGYLPEGTVLEDALSGMLYSVAIGQTTLTVDARGGAILITPEGIDLAPPEAPAGLSAAAGDATVSLTWDTVSDAAGYTIYRSPVRGGGYTALNSIPQAETMYVDNSAANGERTYYVVTAVDGAGNESARSNEVEALPHLVIGWANLQWPPYAVHTLSAVNPTEEIYGQVWIDGSTSLPGPAEGLWAQVGFGPDGSDPDGNPDWAWVEAVFNVDAGSNDEFKGQLLPEASGAYDYAYRYSTTAGQEWLYADLNGTGNGYDPAQAGDLQVNPSADTTPPEAPSSLQVIEASPSVIRLTWDAVADADLYRYEVYRGNTGGGSYDKIGDVPAPVPEYTDLEVTAGNTYYYVVLAADTAFNTSGYSNEVEATAQARPVAVTFSASLADTTPDGDDIYVAGTFNGWDEDGTMMTRPSPSAKSAAVTLMLDEGTQIEYKYLRGSWTYVEKDAACGEVANRTAAIVYGSDGTMTLNDTIENWRNTAPCGD